MLVNLWQIDVTNCIAKKQCGLRLPVKMIYHTGTGADNWHIYDNPIIDMLSVVPNHNKSLILMRMETYTDKKWFNQLYISVNNGKNWKAADFPLDYANIRQELNWNITYQPMSHVDNQILYDCHHAGVDGFKVSTDGGATWEHISPRMNDGKSIKKIRLMETGLMSKSRLYAAITTDNSIRLAVSNDYGRHFEFLPSELKEIVESRADSSIRYGRIVIPTNHEYRKKPTFIGLIKPIDYEKIRGKTWLGISRDDGKTWELMKGSQELWQNLYRNSSSSNHEILSWKQNPDDRAIGFYPETIMQIESDTKNPDWIYVLTSRGLYISRDAGTIFRLSSLAQGWMYSINRIAVDPLDGRYLYAVVDMGKFYRSSDYGCTWEQMPLPVFQPCPPNAKFCITRGHNTR